MKFYRYHIFLVLTQIVHKLDNHIDSIILSYGNQQTPGQGETSAACGMAQVLPAKREHLLCFHAGFGGSGFPFCPPV